MSQLLWAVPLAVWADRGSRKVVAGVSLLIFAGFGAVMALSPNVWAFAFLYLAASVGTGVNNTVHNSYLSDAYPTEGRGRVFSWHQLSDPISQTVGILIFGYVVTIADNWRYGLLVALVGIPLGFALFTLREPEKGANESSHILKSTGMDLQTQQEKAPRCSSARQSPGCCACVRSTTSRRRGHPGLRGTGAPLFGNLFFIDKFHLDTASRSEVYAIIGLAAFLGLPLAYVFGDRYFRKAPQRPLVIVGDLHHGLRRPLRSLLVRAEALDGGGAPVPGHRSGITARHLHLLDAGRDRASGDAHHLFRDVRRLLAVFGGFAGSVVLGAVSDAIGGLHGIIVSLTLIAPVCALGGFLLVLGLAERTPGHHPGDRGRARAVCGRQAARDGGALPALQVHNLDFYYGTNQVLFDVNLEVAEGDGGPSRHERRGEIDAAARGSGWNTRTVASCGSSAQAAPSWNPSRSSTWASPCWWAAR